MSNQLIKYTHQPFFGVRDNFLSPIHFFDEFNSLFKWSANSFNKGLDIEEKDDKYIVSFDLPGFKQSEIQINIENNLLTIEAKNQKRHVTQSFSLWNEIDLFNIEPEAKLEDGVLNIILPKIKKNKKKIEIK